MKWTSVLLFSAVVGLTGCSSMPVPQTPAQFRAEIATGPRGTAHETYHVAGSYRTVAERIRRKADECLNRPLTVRTCYYHANCTTHIDRLHTRFYMYRTHAELSVQDKSNHSIYLGGKPPKDGSFIDVADIMPGRHGGVTISMYDVSVAWMKYIPRAVKHWANDSNLGCPDLTAAMMKP